MSAPNDIIDMLALHLTEQFLLSQDPPRAPIVAGDSWDGRFQVLDENGAAVSLTGASIALAVRKTEVDVAEIFVRKTGVNIAGSNPLVKQIEADADQVNENTVAYTGKGWFVVRFRPQDEATLLLAVATRHYDIRIKFADGSVRTYAAGRFQVRRPNTPNALIP